MDAPPSALQRIYTPPDPAIFRAVRKDSKDATDRRWNRLVLMKVGGSGDLPPLRLGCRVDVTVGAPSNANKH